MARLRRYLRLLKSPNALWTATASLDLFTSTWVFADLLGPNATPSPFHATGTPTGKLDWCSHVSIETASIPFLCRMCSSSNRDGSPQDDAPNLPSLSISSPFPTRHTVSGGRDAEWRQPSHYLYKCFPCSRHLLAWWSKKLAVTASNGSLPYLGGSWSSSEHYTYHSPLSGLPRLSCCHQAPSSEQPGKYSSQQNAIRWLLDSPLSEDHGQRQRLSTQLGMGQVRPTHFDLYLLQMPLRTASGHISLQALPYQMLPHMHLQALKVWFFVQVLGIYSSTIEISMGRGEWLTICLVSAAIVIISRQWRYHVGFST